MTRNNYLAVLALFLGFMTNAQSLDSMYYYYREQKIDLSVDKNFLNIITTDNFDETSLRNLGFKDFMLYDVDEFTQPQKIARLEFEVSPSDSIFKQTMDSLRRIPEIRNIGMFFKRGDSIPPIGTSNIFYVKLKNIEDFNLLLTTANQKGATIERQMAYMPEWYVISVNSPLLGTALTKSSEFYETGLFDAIDPAFMFDFGVKNPIISTNQNTLSPDCNTNDPKFTEQWGLHGEYGINICEAWEITEGLGIKVAVIDNGISISSPHPDLEENIGGNGLNCVTHTSSVIYNYPPDEYQLPQFPYLQSHGTHVSGIIAGVKNNNKGISGVAPQSKIYPVSFPFSFNGYEPDLTDSNLSPHDGNISLTERLANGIQWAWKSGADVINNSWGSSSNDINSFLIEIALEDALESGRNDKGCVIIFSSGNISAMSYPGTFDDRILTVGAVLEDGRRRAYPAGESSGYGPKLDVVAPGEDIWSTVVESPLYKKSGGTSVAAPHASGIAALVLSVAPCLTGQQVRDIIEKTTQKTRPDLYSYENHEERPNGTWHEEVGYGLVDAGAAVELAYEMGKFDLYVRDNLADTGEEPNNIATTWESPDIWVRRLSDQGEGNQNPEYDPTNPNYVYVRVHNKGCMPSSGNNKIQLYWSKASTSMNWDEDWQGNFPDNGPERAGLVDEIAIPVMQPNETKKFEFPWVIPDPEGYAEIAGVGEEQEWHFCLLARIVSDDDPIITETSNTGNYVRLNNNVAQKNVTVINDISKGRIGGTVLIDNPHNETKNFTLSFSADDEETGKLIFEEAEVSITLDDDLVIAWQNAGQQLTNIVRKDYNTFMITDDNASLGIVLNKNQYGVLNLKFNFLTQEVTGKNEFIYRVIQHYSSNNEVLGGETYHIYKDPRTLFYAETGGNIQADKNETIVLSAEPINEPAVYNWYDSEGNLIYEGADFEVSVEIAQTYKLEIIALTDGYKDYSEVEISLNPNSIEALYPNPASTLAMVTYKINEGESAYLAVTGFYGSNVSNNYILDINQNTINLDISSFPQGLYAIALIVNGQIQDSINLIKQ